MMAQQQTTPNHLLLQERLHRHWSQRELAARLGTSFVNVSRWERGITIPGAYFRLRLCELFEKSPQELGLFLDPMSEEQDAPKVPLWSVPYPRNPLFTGRAILLHSLHTFLQQHMTTALTQTSALHGLGGVGKTQVALEYIYRYASAYTAVFWLSADTADTLLASMVTLAEVLNLPERNEQNQQRMVRAVGRWLEHQQGWLLVCDNVENLSVLQPVLPAAHQGSILLTTRLQALGTTARQFNIEPMDLEEGTAFLLQRAKRLHPGTPHVRLVPADVLAAQSIVEAMGGLPLALDQAGAYIEETQCGLADYLVQYQQRRSLLLERRGYGSLDHPESVQATLSLAFQQVQQKNPTALDILRLCAFLAPETIPEEVIIAGLTARHEQELAISRNPWILDEAIAVLRMYSLVHRDPQAKALTLHRLVQMVVREQMDKHEQHVWVTRTIIALKLCFPEVEYETWKQCERLLPHALHCAKYFTSWKATHTEELAALLFKTGMYLTDRDRFTEAEALLKEALQLREQALGAEHPQVATILQALGEVYDILHRDTEAASLLQQALSIREHTLGLDHPEVAESLMSLAGVCWHRGDHRKQEQFLLRACCIWETTLGPDHPKVARVLTRLAALYSQQEHHEEAEQLLLRALHIQKQTLGIDHPHRMGTLNNLALVYKNQGRYTEAEPLLQQALHIREHASGPEHHLLAMPLSNLAELYTQQGKWIEAEQNYRRALHLVEQALGPENPDVMYPLQGLAELYYKQGKYAPAERFFRRALQVCEQTWGTEHPLVAEILKEYAQLFKADATRKEIY